MAISVYTISLFTHILSVILWIGTIFIDIAQHRVLSFVKETTSIVKSLKLANFNLKLALPAQVLILLTGGYMSGSNWFRFSDGWGWLAVKQIIFILMVLFGLTFMRTKLNQMNNEIDAEQLDEAKSTLSLLRRAGHTLSLFIIINIFLAVTKPF